VRVSATEAAFVHFDSTITMNANAASPATPPLATNTLNDLLFWINQGKRYLEKRFQEPKGQDATTRNITHAEMALADKLETIKSRDRWLDTLEQKFLRKYGDNNISSDQWNRLQEKFKESEKAVREERKNVTEHDVADAIEDSLLKRAMYVAGVILGIDIDDDNVVEVTRRPPDGANKGIADVWVYFTDDKPITLFEAKSTKVLHEGNIHDIQTRSQLGGSWKPDFKWPLRVEDLKSKLKKTIVQVPDHLNMEREKHADH